MPVGLEIIWIHPSDYLSFLLGKIIKTFFNRSSIKIIFALIADI